MTHAKLKDFFIQAWKSRNGAHRGSSFGSPLSSKLSVGILCMSQIPPPIHPERTDHRLSVKIDRVGFLIPSHVPLDFRVQGLRLMGTLDRR